MNAMLASDLPLSRIGCGKVRDIYAVGDDRVLLLTTDRISAFDVVMAETIPMKGAVLTQISAWWFNELEGVLHHHMLSADADEIIGEVPALRGHGTSLAGRANRGWESGTASAGSWKRASIRSQGCAARSAKRPASGSSPGGCSASGWASTTADRR